MLQHLQQLFEHHSPQMRNGYAWLSVERAFLLRTLPFWSAEDLHRISRSLVDKGVLLIDSPPLHTASDWCLPSMSRCSQAAAAPEPPATQPSRSGAAPGCCPCTGPQRRPAAADGHEPQHTAPVRPGPTGRFHLLLARARGDQPRLGKQVSPARHQQLAAPPAEPGGSFPRPGDNHPGQQLAPQPGRHGDHGARRYRSDFIEQAIPEFILYWRERGTQPKELNSKFIQHIRIQWAKYTSSLEHSTEPKRISDHWQPTEDVFDILRLSHIDTEFAHSLLPEFIVYWKDSNQAQTSWNSKFIQHVKYHWAKRHQFEQADNSMPDSRDLIQRVAQEIEASRTTSPTPPGQTE